VSIESEIEREHFLAVFDSMADPVAVLSRERQIVFTNCAFKERFGEAKNKPCYELFHGHDGTCKDCNNSEVLASNEAFHSDERVLASDLAFEITKSRCRYRGDETSILMILHDITERKLAEEARS